jgi:malate synthase
VAINNLMEDTATAEISRAQLWQWIHHDGAKTENGESITLERCRGVMNEERQRIEQQRGDAGGNPHIGRAFQLLDDLISADDFADFLTVGACNQLD